jgi:hypothetical protein
MLSSYEESKQRIDSDSDFEHANKPKKKPITLKAAPAKKSI